MVGWGCARAGELSAAPSRRIAAGGHHCPTDVAQSKASDALDGMSWREFEMLVGEGFRLQGFQVVETGGGGADGGIDLVLTKPGTNGGEKFLVQCNQCAT